MTIGRRDTAAGEYETSEGLEVGSGKISNDLRHGVAMAVAAIGAKSAADTIEEGLETVAFPLERQNFRIDSSGWPESVIDGARVAVCPQGDVAEILEGKFAGEQFYTWEAAMRETSKAGKRMPTKEQWLDIVWSINPAIDHYGGWQEDVAIRRTLSLRPAWRLGNETIPYSAACGIYGEYWLASSSGPNGNYVHFSLSRIRPISKKNPERLRSVRCLGQ